MKFHVCDYTPPSTVSFLSRPRARHLYGIESLHPPGDLVPAGVLRRTIEGTRVFEFCPYSVACSVGPRTKSSHIPKRHYPITFCN